MEKEIPQVLFGDEIRIKQCILNLLTNAVKYTEMGQVVFKVSFEEKDEKSIWLKILVSDSGIGMKKEDMDKLFSPFQRIEEKRNRFVEGTGLGLSITEQLLRLMGSQLFVESVYGMGSDFSFTIEQPVLKWEPIGDTWTQEAKKKNHISENKELFHAPEARILVVDDMEMNLVVMENLLKRTMVAVDSAISGKEALQKAAGASYDIIFLDHMMPDMDGIETLRALKKAGLVKNSVCIALTANAVAGARERYLSVGFADYLSKPVDGEGIEKMLLQYLPEEKVEKV
ncbi:MAG: response regulator [Lachnospiraceae bacterium]|nr:response regulator [Lachnospiraceae bacterium]